MSKPNSPSGLIHALLLDGSGGAEHCPWEKVQQWQPGDGCLWLHFDFEEAEAQNWIRQSSGLIDIASEGLLATDTRPRVISRGNRLLMALRGVNMDPGSDPDDMVSVRIWTDGARIISTRCRKLLATDDVLAVLEEGCGPVDVPSLLVEWIDRVVWRMSDTVASFEEEVSDLEDRVLSGQPSNLRTELARLRKQTIGVRRYLAPQREALNRLYSEQIGWVDELNRLRLREVADRLIRHLEDIDAVRERAAMTQEELLTRLSEQMNERTYVFTVVATIFLPLGFFTGLMGINVGGMPGVEDQGAFWLVVGLCLGISLVLLLLFRLKRWL